MFPAAGPIALPRLLGIIQSWNVLCDVDGLDVLESEEGGRDDEIEGKALTAWTTRD
jgi:hypothetical protein